MRGIEVTPKIVTHSCSLVHILCDPRCPDIRFIGKSPSIEERAALLKHEINTLLLVSKNGGMCSRRSGQPSTERKAGSGQVWRLTRMPTQSL